MRKHTQSTGNPFISSVYRLVEKVEITPKLAQFLLDNYNPDNPREASYTGVETIVQSIMANHWRSETGEPLIFERNTGYVLDGQHRLMAIVVSGKTVETSVALGVKRNPYSGWQGRSRTVGAQMATALGAGKDKAASFGRILSIASAWLRNTNPKRKRWDMETKWAFYHQHKDSIDSVLATGENRRAKSAGVRGAFAIYFSKRPSHAQKFFDQIIGDGSNLPSNSPALALRDWLNQRVYGGNNKANDADYRATVAAIHAFENNQKIKVGSLPDSNQWAF